MSTDDLTQFLNLRKSERRNAGQKSRSYGSEQGSISVQEHQSQLNPPVSYTVSQWLFSALGI